MSKTTWEDPWLSITFNYIWRRGLEIDATALPCSRTAVVCMFVDALATVPTQQEKRCQFSDCRYGQDFRRSARAIVAILARSIELIGTLAASL